MNSSKGISYISYNKKVRKTNLSKEISDKVLDFIDRKISIEDFEHWIYQCNQLSCELDCEEYLKLIEFNFQSKDSYYSLDKILYEVLDKHVVEQKNEIVISEMKVSKMAGDMLLEGKLEDTIKRRDEIEKVFEDEGIPAFDKVIDFQERLGGIGYKIGEKFYKGFQMDLFYYNDFKRKYEFKYFIKKDGKYIFQCMDYHYAGDIGPCIGEDGSIYHCACGTFSIAADSIEEFLEDEAIKFHCASKHRDCLTRSVDLDEIECFKKNNQLIKVEKASFTYKYFEWWCNTDETILMRIDFTNKNNHAIVYYKNQEVLR